MMKVVKTSQQWRKWRMYERGYFDKYGIFGEHGKYGEHPLKS